MCLGFSLIAHDTPGSAVSHAKVAAFRIFPSLSWTHSMGPFYESRLWTYRWLWLWRSILTLFAGKLTYDIVTTQRRQAIDPTSEWTRYAQRPIQRSMAIARLAFLKLMPLILFIKIFCRKGSERQERLQTMAGNIFATSLLKLGPLYIKLGQIISSREKLVPKQWKSSMERLQDQVPSRKGKDAMDLADQSWPGGLAHFNETFSDVDWTPLAAASLGQVHTAKLRSSGESVAIKLQRPYLRQIYDQDFVFLTSIATKVDKYFGKTAGSMGGVEQSWTEIFEDAEEILYREIDYRAEAENGIRFCRDFGLTKGGEEAESTATSRDGKPLPSAASWLRAPYVYDKLSTEKVIVMENIPSIKVTASKKLDAANVTAEDREYLADCLGRSYLRQFCCNKFCTE
jgi:predicted unusual protein kinase regulating ubiquinone biosynthesis (AarF/ABC1/UbiB family)